MECNTCNIKKKNKHHEEGSDSESEFRVENVSKSFKPIMFYKLCKNLYDAILFPERARQFKFPAPFQLPTYTFQIKTSFTVTTNSDGHAFVQVTLGQFIDKTISVINSNMFVSNPSVTGYNPNSTTVIQPIQVTPNYLLAQNTNTFTSVRAGPAVVKYEYIGRLDVASGTATMGIAYSTAASLFPSDRDNEGILLEPQYSLLSALEDTPYAKTVSVTDPLRGVYVPHDYSLLNLKSPQDYRSTNVPQRLFIIITGCPNNNPGPTARITIVQNWEALPHRDYADILTATYNESCPSGFEGREVFDYIIRNGLMITRDEKEYEQFDENVFRAMINK